MRKAVTLLQSTLDSTADGILVIGDGGRILTYNKRFVDMWRIPRGAARSARRPRPRSRTCSISSLDPDRLPAHDRHALRAARGGELRAARVQGRPPFRALLDRPRASKASRTSASGASATSRRVSPPRPRCASRSCAIGCCSSRTPPASASSELAGEIVDCNLTYAAMLGFHRAELIGRNAGELYVRTARARRAAVAAARRADAQQRRGRAAEAGRPSRSGCSRI